MQNLRATCKSLSLFACEKKAKQRQIVHFTLELTVCQKQVRCVSI